MSEIKVNSIKGVAATTAALSINNTDGTCTANITSIGGSQLSNRNLIINGAIQVAQRGTTVTCNAGSNFYSMDRWYARGESSLGVFTLSQEDIAANNQGVKYAAKVTVTNNVTPGSGDVYKIAQRIEGQNLAQLELGRSTAKSFTLSFIVKSSVVGTHSGSFMNSAENRSFPFTYTISNPDTWEQKSITIPGDTAGTWLVTNGIGLEVNFDMGTGSGKRGNAGGAWLAARAEGATGAVQVISSANATWFISKVQLELGSVATDFEHRSFAQELALCQRYYYRPIDENNKYLCLGFSDSSTMVSGFLQFPVTMRANPSIDASYGVSGSIGYWRIANGNFGGDKYIDNAWSIVGQTPNATRVYATPRASLTVGEVGFIESKNSSSYMAFTAEL